jgi:hypothetical protein
MQNRICNEVNFWYVICIFFLEKIVFEEFFSITEAVGNVNYVNRQLMETWSSL